MTVVEGQFTIVVGHSMAVFQGHFMTSSRSFYDTNRGNFMTVQCQFMTVQCQFMTAVQG